MATKQRWTDDVPRDVPWFSYGQRPFSQLPDGPGGENVIALADRPWMN
jgi:hypothetical protein